MQPTFDIVADLDTPVSAYLKLAPFRPRFLLESVEGGTQIGRYSFIGFGEADEVRLDGGKVTFNQDTSDIPQDPQDLLALYRRILKDTAKNHFDPGSLPFAGGMVGVTSFEMHRVFEPRPGRDPEQGLLGRYLVPQAVLAFDHLTRRAALLTAGEDSDRNALKKDVIAALRGPLPPRKQVTPHGAPNPSLSKTDFLTAVEKTKQHIQAGDVYQLVLSICFSGACDIPPFEVYRALRLLNPSPYMYFVDFDDMAVVGSSPEALVRLNGRQATLRPIAGTRPRGNTTDSDLALEKDLLDDPKENAEHVMLVDLARNDVGRVSLPGSVTVGPFKTIERYSHVMHMVSGVEGILAPEYDALDLFAAAFPAGTVVGAPKIRAADIIKELEPTRRNIYAGTVGYFGHNGTMDQAIAIRTLVFENGKYSYQAGAGIVADSIPENEHAEVLAKSAALKAALALAEDGL